MKNKYPGRKVKEVKSFSNNPSFESRCVDDVLAAFKSLPRYGNFFAAHDDELVETDAYTGINNHFQGIQRLRDGQHFVLSGGNINDQHAHLFIVKLAYFGLDKNYPQKRIPTQVRTGPVGSNVVLKEKIPGTDKLVDIICLETGLYWHAGGIDLLGDVLAIPFENRKDKTSIIAFYNLKSLRKIERLNNFIVRQSGKCGAVSITKLASEHLLCLTWSDDDDLPDRFEFYISKKKNDLRLFSDVMTVRFDEITNRPNGKSKFQAIQIVKQADDKLFLIATQNTNKLTPKFKGRNEGLLFEIFLGLKSKKSKNLIFKPKIKFLLKRRFASGEQYYNFAAAVGVYIDQQNNFALYSGSHWRSKGAIRFAEFYTHKRKEAEELHDINKARIELYEDINFKKRRLIIYGKRFSKLSKYDNVFVHGINFDDKISSIKYLLPKGVKYRLYDDEKFNGSNKNKNHLTLTGTGYLEELKNLDNKSLKGLKFRRNFNDKCSSSRFIK